MFRLTSFFASQEAELQELHGYVIGRSCLRDTEGFFRVSEGSFTDVVEKLVHCSQFEGMSLPKMRGRC